MSRSLQFILIILLLSFNSLHSQSIISGKLSSSNGPVAFAAIQLQAIDGKFNTGIQSDSTGVFAFSNIPQGKYSITITHIGFNAFALNITVNRDTSLNILLGEESKELSEVVVQGQKATIERSADKVVYNLANSVTASGGDALQAISQLPGVRVNNNEISIAGKG